MGQPHIGADDPELAARVKAAYDGDVEAATGTGMSFGRAVWTMVRWLAVVGVATIAALVLAGLLAHTVELCALAFWHLFMVGWRLA